MTVHAHQFLAVVATAASLTASPSATAVAQSPQGPHIVVVRATDYKFEAPTTAPAGTLTFRLENAGKEVHHLWLVQLQKGRTYADFLKAMDSWNSPRMPDWAI